jgi:hypothetical protein
MNAITYSLSGRLGNQLQLWACARVLALRHNWRFVYNPILGDAEFNLSRKFRNPFASTLDYLLVEKLLALHYKVKPAESRRHQLAQKVLRPFRRIVYLDDASWDETGGIRGEPTAEYQSFSDTLFVLRFNGIFRNLGAERAQVVREVLAGMTLPAPAPATEVGLHLRRDDTEYGLPLAYYVNAIRAAQNSLRVINLHLFSDGAHEQLAAQLQQNFPEIKIIIHRATPLTDLLTLASFPTLILSMSWFSYWAAMFSTAPTIYTSPDFQYYPAWRVVKF